MDEEADGRADPLHRNDRQIVIRSAELKQLRLDLNAVAEENRILKAAIASGEHVAPAIAQAIDAVRSELETVARFEHEKTRRLLEEHRKMEGTK
jgi:hypothetical protein